MNNSQRNLLIDDYEDALFALLMNEVAQAEGERALALNEQLKSDPTAAVPKSVQKRCKKTIRDAFAKKNFHKTVKASKRIFRLLSVAVLVVAMLFTVAFATSSEFRRNALNIVIEVFDEYGVLSFSNYSPQPTSPPSLDGSDFFHYNIEISELPKGYKLLDGWSTESKDFVELANESGDIIDILIVQATENTSYQFDNEDIATENLLIQGFSATLSTKHPDSPSFIRLLWFDSLQGIVVEVVSNNLSRDEIIALANNISWNK